MPDEEGKKHGVVGCPKKDNRIQVRSTNWLMPVILLSLREWNSYGYKLMEQAAAFGFETINPGTLYRTLRQMEENGSVESKWETPDEGGPARRVYSLTDAGEAYLDFWAKALEQYQRNMDAFFRLYTSVPARRNQQKDDR
jgi:PadR family transcriptional regulator, regulatory protein PadR